MIYMKMSTFSGAVVPKTHEAPRFSIYSVSMFFHTHSTFHAKCTYILSDSNFKRTAIVSVCACILCAEKRTAEEQRLKVECYLR